MTAMLASRPIVPVLWAEHPFGSPLSHDFVQDADRPRSLADMVQSITSLPSAFFDGGVIRINDEVVPRALWQHVRPKPSRRDVPVIVTLELPFNGGGGGTLRTILTITVLLAAAAVSGGALGALGAGSLFAAGTIGASVAGAALAIGGSLAIAALIPPPSVAAATGAAAAGAGDGSLDSASLGAASLSGNVLTPGAAVPRSVGTNRVAPPFACEPLAEIIGDDEYVEGVYIMAGPHDLASIKVDTTPIESIVEAQVEIKTLLDPSDYQVALVQRQAKTDAINLEMSKHQVVTSSTISNFAAPLTDQVTIANSFPQWETYVSRNAPDEIWLTLDFPQGVYCLKDATRRIAVPFNIRMRLLGSSTWINLPELHYTTIKVGDRRAVIKLMFEATPGSLPVPPAEEGFYAAWFGTPAGWNADGYFHTDPAANTNKTSAATSAGFGIVNTIVVTGTGKDAGDISFNGTGIGAGARVGTYSLVCRPDNITFDVGFADGSGIPEPSLGPATPGTPFNGEITFTIGTPSVPFASGDAYSISTSPLNAITAVQNVALYADRAEIFLNGSTFPKGVWEIEILQGGPYFRSLPLSDATGSQYPSPLAGHPINFFAAVNPAGTSWDGTGVGPGGPYEVAYYNNINYGATIARVANVWNEHPIQTNDFASIAVKVRNRALGALTTLASGYVKDWDGSGWNTVKTTMNPAPHLRDCWTGALNLDPLPTANVDDASLVDWRSHCGAKGFSCNAVIQGLSVNDASTLIASAGYALVRKSETWGVTIDKNRSAEAPQQIFSARNVQGFAFDKALTKRVDGFRVTYRDASLDYQPTQIVVLDPAATGDEFLADMSYDSIVTAADATTRALYDLAVLKDRMNFYSFTVGANSLRTQRGDLVAVNNDILTNDYGAARVLFVVRSGGLVSSITLDGSVPGPSSTGPIGIMVQLLDGTVWTKPATGLSSSAAEVTEITFSGGGVPDPGPSLLAPDCLAVVGKAGVESKRMLIFSITPKNDLLADMIAVDEAPSITVNL